MPEWLFAVAGCSASALIALVAGRWRLGRIRSRLNRGLHELRRPLQALALSTPDPGLGQLELALDALAALDRELNGGPEPRRERVDARTLAESAARRWREPAACRGRRVELVWRAGRCPVWCEPSAIARAIDNLIANSLEHGSGTVRIEGTRAGKRLRLHVADAARRAAVEPSATAAPDPRRGHGHAVVSSVAANHGGRFAASLGSTGTTAVLELPLAR